MTSSWWSVVVDCADIRAQARFWAAVLDYPILYEDDVEIVVGRDDHTWPALTFLRVPEGKSVKNRLHIDLAPDDQDAEVRRLEGLGASRADIGQGDVSWVVMADPEGNEFCVLTARSGD
jgi:Glyoxalase-like domain